MAAGFAVRHSRGWRGNHLGWRRRHRKFPPGSGTSTAAAALKLGLRAVAALAADPRRRLAALDLEGLLVRHDRLRREWGFSVADRAIPGHPNLTRTLSVQRAGIRTTSTSVPDPQVGAPGSGHSIDYWFHGDGAAVRPVPCRGATVSPQQICHGWQVPTRSGTRIGSTVAMSERRYHLALAPERADRWPDKEGGTTPSRSAVPGNVITGVPPIVPRPGLPGCIATDNKLRCADFT